MIMAVTRFGVSLESELLEALDQYVDANGFPNRSQAVRQLIERNIVEKKWQCNNVVAGTVILVYDRTKRGLIEKIASIQSQYRDEILSTQQFYFSPDSCFEIVAARGRSRVLTELADKLIALKGVFHGKLVMTRTE